MHINAQSWYCRRYKSKERVNGFYFNNSDDLEELFYEIIQRYHTRQFDRLYKFQIKKRSLIGLYRRKILYTNL